MNEKIKQLADIIKNSKNLVFFSGAGCSTDSGLKSFRGKDGLYSSLYKNKYRPEEILSIDFFNRNKDIFIEYIEKEMSMKDIKPNIGHKSLAKLEELGILKAIITQNIDNLHQEAGNKNVIELHGSLKRWYCIACNKNYTYNTECNCGGVVRPEVTLYGEMLDENMVSKAIAAIQGADTLIIAGTSLTVYPAAHYIRYFTGKNLIIINNEKTQYDDIANLVLYSNFSKTMEEVMKILKK